MSLRSCVQVPDGATVKVLSGKTHPLSPQRSVRGKRLRSGLQTHHQLSIYTTNGGKFRLQVIDRRAECLYFNVFSVNFYFCSFDMSSFRWWELFWEILPLGRFYPGGGVMWFIYLIYCCTLVTIVTSFFCFTVDWPRCWRGQKKEPGEEEVEAKGSAPDQAALYKGKRNRSQTFSQTSRHFCSPFKSSNTFHILLVQHERAATKVENNPLKMAPKDRKLGLSLCNRR